MKKFYFFFLIIELILNKTMSQSGNINVIKSDIDNSIYQINNLNGIISANSEYLYLFPTSDFNNYQIISSDKIGIGSEDNQPLFIYKNILDSNILCTLRSVNKEKIVFYSNYWTNSNVVIDSIVIKGNIGGFYVNNPIYRNNKVYLLISGVFGTSTETITFLELDQMGKIKIVFSEARDSVPVRSNLFSHRLILSCTFINENRILLTGLNSLVSVVDTSFNIIYFGRPRFYHNFPNYLTLGYARTSKANDSTLYCTSEFANLTASSILDHLIFKIVLSNDTIKLDSYSIVSNPEKLSKQYNFITGVYNDIYFTISNPYSSEISLKQHINSSFYISKYEGLNEIWHKSYGGDNYYFVTDVASIDSCNFMVGGSIYDYYKNDLLLPFYAIIDCNGNIVNSNLELKEIEPLLIYPNPSSGFIKIQTDEDINRLEIYTLQGRLIKSEQGHFIKQLALIDYLPGTYLLKIFFNGKYRTETIILN